MQGTPPSSFSFLSRCFSRPCRHLGDGTAFWRSRRPRRLPPLVYVEEHQRRHYPVPRWLGRLRDQVLGHLHRPLLPRVRARWRHPSSRCTRARQLVHRACLFGFVPLRPLLRPEVILKRAHGTYTIDGRCRSLSVLHLRCKNGLQPAPSLAHQYFLFLGPPFLENVVRGRVLPPFFGPGFRPPRRTFPKYFQRSPLTRSLSSTASPCTSSTASCCTSSSGGGGGLGVGALISTYTFRGTQSATPYPAPGGGRRPPRGHEVDRRDAELAIGRAARIHRWGENK